MTTDREPPAALDATASAHSDPVAKAAAAAGAGELRSGDTLGRYVLGESLGAGGMGRVFRARDPDLGREVAIKVLHAGGDGSGGALERRLLREAQAMATLSHDNLASVYDIGTSEGRVFVAMELIDGGSLRALIADRERGWRDKLAAVTAAGRGLAAAHSAGVIHRDFKPDNVLLARSGRVKVVDFGLARAEAPDASDASPRALPADLSANLTQTGALLGTPAYMAPEQHAGESVDARADQFAFAVTAWEAVYGRRPFPADSYSTLVAAVEAHAVVPPPRGTGVPAALEAVLRRALARAPRDRYTSMDALLAAIDDAIRPRRAAPWIAAGALAVVAAGGVTTYAVTRDRGGAAPEGAPAGVSTAAAAVAPAGRGTRAVAKVRRANPTGSRTSVNVAELDLADLMRAGSRDSDEAEQRFMLHLNQASVVRSHQAEAIACYDGAREREAGMIVIEYQLDPRGKVVDAQVLENPLDDAVATCLVAASRRWRFPATDEPTTVRFPFVFDPDGKDEDDEDRGGFDGLRVNLPVVPDLGGFEVPAPPEQPEAPGLPPPPPAPPAPPAAPEP